MIDPEKETNENFTSEKKTKSHISLYAEIKSLSKAYFRNENLDEQVDIIVTSLRYYGFEYNGFHRWVLHEDTIEMGLNLHISNDRINEEKLVRAVITVNGRAYSVSPRYELLFEEDPHITNIYAYVSLDISEINFISSDSGIQ